MTNYIIPFCILFSIIGCTPKYSDDASIRIGADNCFCKESTEQLVPYDSILKDLESHFNDLGKVQIPINKILKADNYTLFINICMPNNKELFFQAHEKQNYFEIIKKLNDSSLILKKDTLYCARTFCKNISPKFTFVIDVISTDSSVAFQTSQNSKRFNCDHYKM